MDVKVYEHMMPKESVPCPATPKTASPAEQSGCSHLRQQYFRRPIPCAEPGCHAGKPGDHLKIPVGAQYGMVAVMFARVWRDCGYHWEPQPCIDASSNAQLTADLIANGLEAALIPSTAPIAPPPTSKPPLGEWTVLDGCDCKGCSSRPAPVPSPGVAPTWAWTPTSPTPHVGATVRDPNTDKHYMWDGTNWKEIGFGADPVLPLPSGVGKGQGPVAAPSLPARRIEQNQASTLCHSCRLGSACTHGPKVREPFIPKVDEWDLLPGVDER